MVLAASTVEMMRSVNFQAPKAPYEWLGDGLFATKVEQGWASEGLLVLVEVGSLVSVQAWPADSGTTARSLVPLVQRAVVSLSPEVLLWRQREKMAVRSLTWQVQV